MTTLAWMGLAAGAFLVTYGCVVVGLVLAGRRSDARAVAGFIPDCVVLFTRLLGDERIGGWRRAAVVALVAYLAMPIDLVPDFIPVAGQLDDILLAAFVLRLVLGGAGPEVVREHWPGPASSLALMVRVAGGEPSEGAGGEPSEGVAKRPGASRPPRRRFPP